MKHLRKFNENNMEMNIHGLKCDNPNCDWNDMSVPFDDYVSHVNAPCPECGENILKEEEYQKLLQMKNAVNALNAMSEEDIQNMLVNLSPEEMDAALDQMNDLIKMFKLKKTDNDDGTETWSAEDNIDDVNESLPRQGTVDQWKKLRKMTKGTDIGDRIPDLMKQGANIQYSGNVVDRGIESYEDYERHNKKFVPSWNLKHLMSPFRGESKKK